MDLKNTPRKLCLILVFCLKVNGVLLAVDFLVPVFLSLIWGKNMDGLTLVGFSSTLLFLEAGLMFLIGGATEMTSTVFFSKVREYVFHSKESWSIDSYKKARQKALQYIIIGTMLFAESITLAIVT